MCQGNLAPAIARAEIFLKAFPKINVEKEPRRTLEEGWTRATGLKNQIPEDLNSEEGLDESFYVLADETLQG
jgi:hypothetical protein